MKLTAEVIDAMIAAGCTAEQIGAAVKAAMHHDEASVSERRERDRIRKREERARKKTNENNNRVRSVTRTTMDSADNLPSPEVSPHTPLPKPLPSIPPSPPKGGSSPADEAFSEFQGTAERAKIPVPRQLTADRRRKLEARLREHGLDGWREACRKLEASSFCRGSNERGWVADLDFLLQPKSLNRLLEGGYDDRQSRAPPGKPPSAFDQFTDYVNSLDDDDGQADFEAHSTTDSRLRLIAGYGQP